MKKYLLTIITIYFFIKSISYAAELTQEQINLIISNTSHTAEHIDDVGIVDQDSLATLLKALDKSGTRERMERMASSSERREIISNEMLKKQDKMYEAMIVAIGKINTNSINIKENRNEILVLKRDATEDKKDLYEFKIKSMQNYGEHDKKILSAEEKSERNKEDINRLVYWGIYALLGILGMLITHEMIDRKRHSNN